MSYRHGDWIFKKRPSDPVLSYWDALCKDVLEMLYAHFTEYPIGFMGFISTAMYGLPIVAVQTIEAKRLGIRRAR